MANVVIYTTMLCPYCHRAKHLLKQKNIAFNEIDVTLHAEKRAEMMKQANGRSSVPQIFINHQGIGGCDELYALERAGKLDELLTAADG